MQVVAGYHVHMTMSTKDAAGNRHLVHAMMHRCGHSGNHTTVTADAYEAPLMEANLDKADSPDDDTISVSAVAAVLFSIGNHVLGILLGVLGLWMYQQRTPSNNAHTANPKAATDKTAQSERPRATSAAAIDVQMVPKEAQQGDNEHDSSTALAASPDGTVGQGASEDQQPAGQADAVPTA